MQVYKLEPTSSNKLEAEFEIEIPNTFFLELLFFWWFLKISWSPERALLPRPAAYEAAALLGWAIEAPYLLISEAQVFKCFTR